MAPRIIDDPLYQLLRHEQIEEFNEQRKALDSLDFSNCDFRGLDLRDMNADGVDFSGAYFRGADLRGINFRHTRLQGASMAAAQISGCYFPDDVSAAEIELSVTRGTRLRTDR